MKFSRQLAFAAIGVGITVGAFAAQPTVLLEVGTVKITDQDLLASIHPGTPAAERERMLATEKGVAQTARNLAARRLLALEAEKNGLAAQPLVKAQRKLADERALSDARIAQFEAANAPDAKALNDYAQSEYRANPKLFTLPPESRARHILIEGDTPESKAKAEKLLAEIKAGGDFAKLAEANSEDKGSAARGGELAFAPSSRYVPAFGEALDELKKPGDVSPLVKTQFGWHIIKLEERRAERTIPYEEVAEQLKSDAAKRMVNEKRLAMTNGLIKDAKINEDAIKALKNSAAAQPAAK